MRKFEIRNSKSETNPKHEIQNVTDIANAAPMAKAAFGHLDFEFVSDFEFRISNFRRRQRRRGFTLIEVLATMLLISIVLPAVMEGIVLGSHVASNARRRSEAAQLAHEKIDELIATVQWNGGAMSGDFSAMGWPDYTWQATTNAWAQDTTGLNLQELDVTVNWTANGSPHSVQVSSLVYVRGQEATAAPL